MGYSLFLNRGASKDCKKCQEIRKKMAQPNESANEKAMALHEERKKLADVIRHIEEAKKRLDGQMPAIAWDQGDG